jgi:hypothetical protein
VSTLVEIELRRRAGDEIIRNAHRRMVLLQQQMASRLFIHTCWMVYHDTMHKALGDDR